MTYRLEMSHLQGKKREREKKMDQFEEQKKMSLEYTCSQKECHDKLRYNSTGREKKSQTAIRIRCLQERCSTYTPQHRAAN